MKRNISLDLLRILACMMVVFMHSPVPSSNAYGPFLSALSYITAPCIGLFFMVSGALLLPVKTDYFTFLNRRFSKIIVPTLIWSLIYIGLNLYESKSEINLLQQLGSLPFSNQGSGVLWFMYTLAGLYLLAPILSTWVQQATKRELQCVLGLWGITMCYPLIQFIGLITNTSTTGILYYFGGYAGYFLLGYYMRRFPDSMSVAASFGIAGFGIVLLLLLKYFNIPFDFYQLFWYESIFIVALAVVIWKTINYISKKYSQSLHRYGQYIEVISNVSFGVYLVHILIMRHWLWTQSWIIEIHNYIIQTLCVAILTLVFSNIFCVLICRIPGAQWLIGYRKR
ncbi:MAG: acyltransferase [Bacteroides sp.]|nr:acyltransferase [Bacteroides sp.]